MVARVEDAEELEPGDESGVGTCRGSSGASRLPYRLEFEVRTERVERPHLMEGHAVGELSGTGRWRLFDHDGVTAVLYEWNVSTSRAWMNLLAPIGRPIFEWNHNWVMARGGEGLARRVGCELLAEG